MICDTEANVGALILQGVCDELTMDRDSLAAFATSLLTAPKRQGAFMEPEGVKFTKLEQIFDGFKMCGGVDDWKRANDGGFDVKVTRARGHAPTEIHFLPAGHPKLKAICAHWDRN